MCAGVGLLLTAQRRLKGVASVFTTHATLLGRYLSAGRVDMYKPGFLEHDMRVDEEAGRRGIFHRHWIEREAANRANVFTTVSEITALEALHILGRQADVIVPNGLNVKRYTSLAVFLSVSYAYIERQRQEMRECG